MEGFLSLAISVPETLMVTIEIEPVNGFLNSEEQASLRFKRTSPSSSTGRINCKVVKHFKLTEQFYFTCWIIHSNLSAPLLPSPPLFPACMASCILAKTKNQICSPNTDIQCIHSSQEVVDTPTDYNIQK
ncbi:hypothetical protein ABZP36_017895 [Zizania latifolia]